MIYKIRKFTDSTYFTNALKVTIAAVIPFILFSLLGNFEMGFTIALGAFFTYPSDIPSNLKHKINGVLVAAVIVSSVNLLVNIIYPYNWIFYPFLALLIFLFSMISVYGQRATVVSFSALLSISLAFAHINTGWDMVKHSGLILAGGIFYLMISLIFHYIRPHRYIELQIAECIKLTAKYLKLRGDLWTVNADKKAIIEKQLHLQVELNTIRQNIREVLISNHTSSGSSNQNRKMLIVFITLVEILELALSTSFDHDKLHQKFDDHPKVLQTYQNLAYNLAASLKQLSKSVQNKTKYVSKHTLIKDLNALQLAIVDYENELGKIPASEGVFMLTTMLQYAEKQVEKIKIVERAFTLAFNSKDFKEKDKDLEKFLTPQYYPLSTLTGNMSFSSTIFRHSLRLTITILIGFIIGTILPFHNVYWILLTIIVIMRPGYGLTKQRSFQRIFGTILGGLIAFGILSLVHNSIVISILSILCMLLGFSFTQTNYKVSATFVTMYIVFIYGILTPNIADVIQYRILDTVVGAALAFLANHFLWPSWEFLNIPIHLKKSIKANQTYLKEISVFYNKKGAISTSYRLARKNAFIEIGNLMASFQRMSQEPKSKQKQLPQVYKLAVLNHSLLSSLASLGTYIQSHKTTSASEAFNIVVDTVYKNLDHAIAILKENDLDFNENTPKEELAMRFTELKNIRAKELKEGNPIDEEAFQLKMQEAQLVIEQLIWLTNLSENIVKTTKELIAT
ncbi:putative membrane protein (TIGR01666 family) [Flavobacterium sp. CG_23.5]|uniref:FUSC family protein n=1 Tax=unclassified Flavobacterium TaxID=196869 RepID=UPI0018CAD473|nr:MULTISPECIES: FUSC family membrane protein [unclassified Flavobacterium]MBG6111099.1 putative membrane protein (TIGR01666 family) [Flavobacterium sp. CG_9.10]MBP2282546.1 putative membrane protein (TIGR01666 family) [Flavobacterium sp. CG_23.5]